MLGVLGIAAIGLLAWLLGPFWFLAVLAIMLLTVRCDPGPRC